MFAESLVSRNYSLKKGISSDSIIVENVSNSSIDNLYFAFSVAEKYHLKNYIIVSDPMHMLRTICIANYFKKKCWSSPTPTSRFVTGKSKFIFAANEAWNILKLYRNLIFSSDYDKNILPQNI